ncbi:MAG TPA: OmpA family protein [Candidatus Limnocylindrales bacterium]|nr:OmpA family protein [Candidatus Limnocylindrales bacterium]
MKRFLVVLALAGAAWAQQGGTMPQSAAPQQIQKMRAQNLNIGNTPTPADMYCAGFISSEKVPDSHFVAGGWNTPDQTRFAGTADYVYLHGKDFKEGDRYQIVRRVRDPNAYSMFSGQRWAINDAGTPYFELGYVRIIDVQKNTAVAIPELSCADFVPGDLAVPFAEREAPKFRAVSLDRFAPPNGKPQGRIIMANEFDAYLGTKNKVYLSIGADKGLKPGDYLRATRTYNSTYHDQVDKLSLYASALEDTQKDPAKFNDVASLPRRTLGDMIVLSTHRKSATAMILTALEEIKVGDVVEVMDVEAAPELKPVLPVSATQPTAAVAAEPAASANAQPPRITCTASPATVRVGENSMITCDATSADNRPISIAFVANGGKLSSNRNQATLDTTDTQPGPVTVRATAFDDRQLSAAAITTVNVEAGAAPAPTAQKLSDLDFKPNSAYVDNRSKAILDDVALKLQQDPNTNVSLSGSTEELEPPRLANQRAENSKTYLTQSKGIDPQRVAVKSGGTGRRVEIWTVPAGAPAPPEQPKSDQPKQ